MTFQSSTAGFRPIRDRFPSGFVRIGDKYFSDRREEPTTLFIC